MIDHLLHFDDEEQALADPALAGHRNGAAWHLSYCIPGVRVWRPADDTEEEGGGVPVIVHDYLPYWYILLSRPALDEALREHPNCVLVTNREKGAAGDPSFVLHAALPSGELADYMVEPTFAGSAYPFGALP